jgi:hypothetical protein
VIITVPNIKSFAMNHITVLCLWCDLRDDSYPLLLRKRRNGTNDQEKENLTFFFWLVQLGQQIAIYQKEIDAF